MSDTSLNAAPTGAPFEPKGAAFSPETLHPGSGTLHPCEVLPTDDLQIKSPECDEKQGCSEVHRFVSLAEAVDLVGVKRQPLHRRLEKAGVLQERICPSGHNRGRMEWVVSLESLYALYPNARPVDPEPIPAPAQAPLATPSIYKARDPQQVVLRADVKSLERHQAIWQARLSFLERAIRPLVADLSEYRRLRAPGGLPDPIAFEALNWLSGHPEALKLRSILGVPSAQTIRRWWVALTQDPSGLALKPGWCGAGRKRKTDTMPDLGDEIRGAFAFAGTYAGAAEELRKRGLDISESTVRRRLSELDQAVLVGLRMGSRKALTDHGPYVRRRPSLPFQCWSIDGHTFDAQVIWDDPLPGEVMDPFRPTLYVVRDVGSGAILDITIGHGLNRYLPLTALASAILRFGVIPEHIQSDNGSEVKNAFFFGDDDTVGYFAQIGMDWTDGAALWRGALPYNSRSKPVERNNRDLSRNFAAKLPAYVGGNPSARPGDPLNDARRRGQFETVASLKSKLTAWLEDEIQKPHTVQRHTIIPARALDEQRQRLVEQLGPGHPRILRAGQEWRVLPGLKGRLVRGFVTCRIEGQELRFHTELLDGLDSEGLIVRINPWDVTQAWLCRGGELVDALIYVPDGPELGAGTTDVVALRICKNIERRQKGILRQAERLQERNRVEAGMLTRRLGFTEAPAEQAPSSNRVELSDMDRRVQVEADEARAALGISRDAEVPMATVNAAADPAVGIGARRVPSIRAEIRDDFDYALYVYAHHETPDVDVEEIRELNKQIKDDATLRLRMARVFGEQPTPISIRRQA